MITDFGEIHQMRALGLEFGLLFAALVLKNRRRAATEQAAERGEATEAA